MHPSVSPQMTTNPSVSTDEPLESGGNFKAEFQSALSNNFDFKGKFAHSELLINAPSPGISVDGVGPLCLPLSERDAKLIIATSEQAPSGHGERTIIDKEVRDTCEIAAERIRFTNQLWEPFMVNIAKSVFTHLGVMVADSVPRIELYKLLLYEKGSFFLLPHKDHEKTKGMFATIIIILPSIYTGGQVHVSHSQATDVFDFSANSAFGTALLSWYTDVTHEVKPIQSGYRLALSYNLIHTAPKTLPPMLPDISAAALKLRRVLRKWQKGLYEGHPVKVCYMLDHHYTPANLKDSALKSVDAHRLSFIRPLCEEFGFKIYLANLEYYMSGEGDGGCTYAYNKRRRHGWYDDSDDIGNHDDGQMRHIYRMTMTVNELQDPDGRPPAPNLCSFVVANQDLIPENAFKDKEPDKKQYGEGILGRSMKYWYHRTVMVLWHESHEVDLLIDIGGITAAMEKLKCPADSPTHEQENIFKYFITRLSSFGCYRDEITRTLANAAIAWNNIDMWLNVARSSGAGRDIHRLGVESHVQALNAFPFEHLRTTLEEAIQTEWHFKFRVKFIHQLSSAVRGDAAFDTWCYDQMTAVLGSLKALDPEECLVLIAEAEKRDISYLRDTIMPQLEKLRMSQCSWVEIVRTLHARADLLDTPTTSPHPWHAGRSALNAVAGEGLQIILRHISAKEFFSLPFEYAMYYGDQDIPEAAVCEWGVERTVEILELCVSMKRLDDCEMVFQKLLDPKSTPQNELEMRFSSFFKPLVPKLKDFLQKHSLHEDIPPFKDFFKKLIRLYLDKLVGIAPPEIDPKKWAPKTIGCGCEDCIILDRFIMDPQTTVTFRVAAARREHLLSQIEAGSADGKRYSTEIIASGRPHQLVVKKDPNARPRVARAWCARRSKANEFMKTIGDTELLKRILSEEADGRSANLATPVAATQAGPSRRPAAAPAAGARKKRKLHSNGVIDLT